MNYPEHFDVIVIGAGNAGLEACFSASSMKAKTLLLTNSIETIGTLSCNPSIGGVGKSQILADMDALGASKMALCADHSAINIKILNRSKGPAMYARHAIVDRQIYRDKMRKYVENQPNLSIFQQEVDDIIMEGDKVVGVITKLGIKFMAHTVIVTAGTFLNGRIHVGLNSYNGGRAGEQSSIGLAERLKEMKLPQGRLKTGTPARIDGRTIDFSKLQAQHSDGIEDGNIPVFSLMGNKEMHPQQLPCYYTRTSLETHDILRASFEESPMFNKTIVGKGPRYCPSIEDKIIRFADKDSHQIILEPEGLNVNEYYPNGISTSLPFDTQYRAIRTLPGCENAHLTRPGYAIEYDYYEPTCLKQSFEVKNIQGLFLAASSVGLSGYTETGASGAIAGINAVLYARGESAWVPQRHDSYIGVMIDDLTSKGITEPYRMFTSRAEYRLHLREDNADLRLTEIGRKLGTVSDEQWDMFCRKRDAIDKIEEQFKNTWVNPKIVSKVETQEHLGIDINHEFNLAELIKRPDISYEQIVSMPSVQALAPELTISSLQAEFGVPLAEKITEQVDVFFKYEGYINKQKDEVAKLNANNHVELPQNFDYANIPSLGNEVTQIMNKYQPETLGQASRITGITPSAISLILVYLKKQSLLKQRSESV